MKRAVLYARVSGDDRGKEGRNLAGQLEMGREYAQEHGYQVVTELAEDDKGASGAEIDLPQLSRARDMAAAGEFDVLVVRELDRLSRNLAKQLIVEQELQQAGVAIEYVLGEYPDTPEGRLNKHIKATVAEYEREKIRERTVRAKRRKAADGHVITHSRPPYGYRQAEVDGKQTLVIHEPEARTVRLIYQWYTAGDMKNPPVSMRGIAKQLTQMGIPTWQDIHKMGGKKRGYGEWRPAVVGHLLSNETYAGVWYYGRRNSRARKDNLHEHWIAVDVPGIVPRETWEAAQKRKIRNGRMSKRNTQREYLVGRRVCCGECGSSMYGRSTTVGGKTYLYYRCNAYKGHIANVTCDMLSFRVDQVDTVAWDWVRSFLTDPAALAEGLKAEQAEREEANEPLRDRLAVVDDLLADNRRQLGRALDLYLSGDFPKEMLTERKARLEKTVSALGRERVGLAAQLEAQTLTSEQVQTITEFAQQVARGLETADQDFEARRRVVDMLDVRATLAVENGVKVMYVRCMLGDDTLSIASRTSRG